MTTAVNFGRKASKQTNKQMARPRSSVDNLGMFGCFEKFCFYILMGRSSEIVMPHEILKINHICTCSTQKGTFIPRDKFSRMRTWKSILIMQKVGHGIQVKKYYDNFSIYDVFEK